MLMRIDITGGNKAKILVALFNNAKKSDHTWETVAREFYSESPDVVYYKLLR